jgi:lipopolysaccharide export system permease protein
MFTIQRYVVWEVVKTFLIVLAVTTLFMTLGSGANEGLRKGLPPHLIAKIIPYVLPEALRFTIPGCLLFAVCTVYGRMSGSLEATALKSLGISPLSIVWPTLAFAFVTSLVTFAMYDACAAWGRPGLRRVVVGSLDEIVYGVLKTERAYSSDKLSINVKGVEDGDLITPVIVMRESGDLPAVTLKAAKARLSVDHEEELLRVQCTDGRIEVPGKATLTFRDTFEQAVAFDQHIKIDPNKATPANLALAAIPRQAQREQRIIHDLDRTIEKMKAAGKQPKQALVNNFNNHRLRYYRLVTEGPRRRSNGFSCMLFALMGMAVALNLRLSDNVTVFFLCFMPILLIYYPLMVVGEYVATKGILPADAVWLPNAVMAVIGIILLQRVMRY